MMTIQSNLSALKNSLPDSCRVVVVSKTQAESRILDAYNTPHRLFGENKVQELVPKYNALPKDIEWHMIGHLQSNKVKYIAPFVTLIHSVDSIRLLEEIDRQGARNNRVIPCLLQLHIASEETKFGFSEAEVHDLVGSPLIDRLHHIKITGLMGMATFTDDTEKVRAEFRGLKQFYNKLKASSLPAGFQLTELSMGMSADYRIAIEEGSTLIRVGTAIFGERVQQHTST